MQELLNWKQKKERKPLILQGVRQVGKTHLLTEFGKRYFRKTHLINFEKQIRLKELFKQDLDPQRIINELRFQLGDNIDIEQDLLIFDEIQACPSALTSLKYFCEDMPQLALCSAGSLLGLQLNEGSYPVGKVDMMHLYPMTFSEFLAGTGDSMRANVITQYNSFAVISELNHEKLWEKLKIYFVTGGLPEVVNTYSHQQENTYQALQLVRKKQDELIQAYYADMAKHSGKVNAMHIDRTWRAVPTQLAMNHDTSSNRFRFKGVIPQLNRYRQLVDAIDWLEAAELIIRLPIASAFEQPISAYTKENLFKLMLFDVGILGAMNDIDPDTILKYEYGTYKGYFAENYVAQQLIASGYKRLYNWQENRSKIEFLIQHRSHVIPIEVKSGTIVRAKSLQKYIDKYSPEKSIILSAKQPSQNKTVLHLPLYLTEKVENFC